MRTFGGIGPPKRRGTTRRRAVVPANGDLCGMRNWADKLMTNEANFIDEYQALRTEIVATYSRRATIQSVGTTLFAGLQSAAYSGLGFLDRALSSIRR